VSESKVVSQSDTLLGKELEVGCHSKSILGYGQLMSRLTISGRHVKVGIFKPDGDISVEGFALDVAGRAISASSSLSSIDIGSVCCSRGSWCCNDSRNQGGSSEETHFGGC
jgi:hypothetical protein